MEVKKKSKKKDSKTKKVEEIFELEKDGKTKTVKGVGKVEEKKSSKKQIKNQNKILIGFFVIVGILAIFGVSYFLFSYNQTNFEYRGIDFKLVKEGNLYFYNMIIPLTGEQGQKIDFNIYTRTDPRKTEKEVPFIGGEIALKQVLILNSTEDFVCDGDGAISVGNLANVYSAIKTKVLKDTNASCDPEGRYAYLLITKGEENKIEQVGEACYVASVKDCDILKVSERFVYETLVRVNKILN
jgi:hypothetical protein